MIESWNQLAAKDQWASDNGYRSRQSISVVERSRTYGEKRRRILGIEEVRDNLPTEHYRPPAARVRGVTRRP